MNILSSIHERSSNSTALLTRVKLLGPRMTFRQSVYGSVLAVKFDDLRHQRDINALISPRFNELGFATSVLLCRCAQQLGSPRDAKFLYSKR